MSLGRQTTTAVRELLTAALVEILFGTVSLSKAAIAVQQRVQETSSRSVSVLSRFVSKPMSPSYAAAPGSRLFE